VSEEIKNKADWNLIATYLSGNSNTDDRVRLENWIAESEENKIIFEKAKSIWKSAEGIDVSLLNVEKAWDKVNKRAKISHASSSVPIFLQTKYLLRIAAVLIVGLVSFWFIHTNVNNKVVNAPELMQLALSDGSTINLNKGAKLIYPEEFKGTTREVYLTGEAFFTISRNPEKPFIIHTTKADIRVLGTSFNVNTQSNGDVEVTVKTGIVKVTAADELSEVILQKNERVAFNANTGKMQKGLSTNLNYLAWKTHNFEFRETSLHEVFANLEKVYNVKISVSDTSIYNCKLTATYENLQASEIVQMIEMTFGFKTTINGNKINVTGGNCKLN
jgi:transmembrane sensor